jgi:uncharacterized protein (UPF0332 family)
MLSELKKKSDKLNKATDLLHNNELYPAVAHSAYYCCLQLMKHIWLHSMNGTEREITQSKSGTHDFLIKRIGKHIRHSNKYDFYIFRQIRKLKNLRICADYSDQSFDKAKSFESLKLSKSIILILKKY